jgi:hypothetical protein
MTGGAITVPPRPRVRGLEERFESRVLPLLVQCTKQVRELVPQLYVHGLARGELALRGLLSERVPLWVASVEWPRGKWQLEYEAWSKRSPEDLEVAPA